MITCPRCDYENPPATLLCRDCGARLRSPAPRAETPPSPGAESLPPEPGPLVPDPSPRLFSPWRLMWLGTAIVLASLLLALLLSPPRKTLVKLLPGAIRELAKRSPDSGKGAAKRPKYPAGAPSTSSPTSSGRRPPRRSSGPSVYLGDYGNWYHREECRRLVRYKKAVSRQEALDRNLKPCPECQPP